MKEHIVAHDMVGVEVSLRPVSRLHRHIRLTAEFGPKHRESAWPKIHIPFNWATELVTGLAHFSQAEVSKLRKVTIDKPEEAILAIKLNGIPCPAKAWIKELYPHHRIFLPLCGIQRWQLFQDRFGQQFHALVHPLPFGGQLVIIKPGQSTTIGSTLAKLTHISPSWKREETVTDSQTVPAKTKTTLLRYCAYCVNTSKDKVEKQISRKHHQKGTKRKAVRLIK